MVRHHSWNPNTSRSSRRSSMPPNDDVQKSPKPAPTRRRARTRRRRRVGRAARPRAVGADIVSANGLCSSSRPGPRRAPPRVRVRRLDLIRRCRRRNQRWRSDARRVCRRRTELQRRCGPDCMWHQVCRPREGRFQLWDVRAGLRSRRAMFGWCLQTGLPYRRRRLRDRRGRPDECMSTLQPRVVEHRVDAQCRRRRVRNQRCLRERRLLRGMLHRRSLRPDGHCRRGESLSALRYRDVHQCVDPVRRRHDLRRRPRLQREPLRGGLLHRRRVRRLGRRRRDERLPALRAHHRDGRMVAACRRHELR